MSSIDPGPTLADLVERYRGHLTTKTPGAVRAFASIAVKLEPLADRLVLTISASQWEGWLAQATAGFSESTRRQLRAYVRAVLAGTPHWLARGPSRPRTMKRPALKLTPAERQALKEGPSPDHLSRRFRDLYRTERDGLIGYLVVAGFYAREIQAVRLAGDGRVELGRPNWGRHLAPASLPQDLEARLQRYAVAKGIQAGAPLFPLSGSGIRLIVQRAVHRAGETQAPAPRLPQRLREILRSGSQSTSALAEALNEKAGSVYKSLRRMRDVEQLADPRGRGHNARWGLVPPPGRE